MVFKEERRGTVKQRQVCTVFVTIVVDPCPTPWQNEKTGTFLPWTFVMFNLKYFTLNESCSSAAYENFLQGLVDAFLTQHSETPKPRNRCCLGIKIQVYGQVRSVFLVQDSSEEIQGATVVSRWMWLVCSGVWNCNPPNLAIHAIPKWLPFLSICAVEIRLEGWNS